MNRTLKYRLSGVLLVALGLATLPHAASAEEELIVADQKGQQKALMEAAGADKDLHYHIHWVEFAAAAPLLQALGAGAVDTGIAGDGPFLFAWGAGLPIKAAYMLPPKGGGSATAVVVPEGSAITSLAQLSGRRIATGKGSIGHLLLLRLLANHAIPAPAPEISFLSPVQAKAALDTGRVDAWSTWEPYVSLEAIGNHGHILGDASGIMPNNDFFVANSDALSKKPQLLADFYHRMTQAYSWGIKHPTDYAGILSQQTGIPPNVAAAVAQKLIGIPSPVTPDVVQAEAGVLETYHAAHLLTPTQPIAEAFELNFSPP